MRKLKFLNHLNRIYKDKNNLHYLLLFPLLLAAFYVYTPALDNSFLSWDDQFYVTDNPSIQNPTCESLKTVATQVVSLNYHPLTMMSLWMNAKISGTDAASPYIWTNLLIHLLNTILAFVLAYDLSQRKWIVALTAAILFSLHPMHVESVVWVSERKDVLYALFFLGSLVSYVKYVDSKTWRNFALALTLFSASCFSKAMAVALVPTLFLVDVLKQRSLSSMKVLVEKIPFIVLGLLTGMIALNV